MSISFNNKDCLLIVDLQNDFCPEGALPVPEGDKTAEAINPYINKALEAKALIAASRDWHPFNHCSFQSEGGIWPRHCVQGTRGAEFHHSLNLPKDALIISKGTNPEKEAYSAFEDTGLEEILKERGIKRVVVGGLALDYCVKASALDAKKAGFEVVLLKNATRAVNVNPTDGEKALEVLSSNGVYIVENE
ncbi:MAG: nicotinamidase [Candidatus Dadabacteria bacterium]|nr:MAG: nicotinamidase [Candidatus Dadabacteria bacterium]